MISKVLKDPADFEGRLVRLVPLSETHVHALFQAARDPEIWTFWTQGPPLDERTLQAWVGKLLKDWKGGTVLPFTILSVDEGYAPVGMTRFMEIRREHHRAEIGGTWLTRRLWGTFANVEAKYLMLQHAFESEKLSRVEFKTDIRNIRSQKALEKIGAKREGVLRCHMTVQGGFQRDSVYYSIILDEWPSAKAHLERLLSKA